MTQATANVVICGAGVAGISAAYHLVVKHGISKVVLVDERSPLRESEKAGDLACQR